MTILPSSEWKAGAEGIYSDLPAEVYHAAPGLSHSMTKNLSPPARLPVYLTEKRVPTEAMIMGTLTHAMILEPDKPLPVVAISPEGLDFRTKEGKDWKSANAGRIHLKFDLGEKVKGMVKAIAEHPVCQSIFREGKTELSCFRRHENGTLLKMRLDHLPPVQSQSLVDVKTCQDEKAAGEEFSKVIFDQRYYTQAAWYLDNWNSLTGEDRRFFTFVAVEKAAPYLVALHYMESGDATYTHARKLNEYNIGLYARCAASNSWPGYDPAPQRIQIPEWAGRRESAKEVSRWMESLSAKA